jgi:Domain of unknown function (DUF5666)
VKTAIIAVAAAVIVGIAAFFGGVAYGKSTAPKSNTISVDAFKNMSQQQQRQFIQQVFQSGALQGGAGGLFGGPDSTGPNSTGPNSTGPNGQRNGNFRGLGGGTVGQILSKDANSITVKLPDGSTKIVFLSGTTTVDKTAQGKASDLAAGQNVVVAGSANSDGSITAQRITVRPADTPGPTG